VESRRPRVCIVTPGYLSSTPRVVREADALSEAGCDVRVVHTQGPIDALRTFDAELVSTRSWRAEAFRWSGHRPGERLAHRATGVRHRLAQRLSPGFFDVPGLAERGEGRAYPELARLAGRGSADLFIGHYPSGLAAAAWAAARHGAQLGYDIEDLYAETFPNSPAWKRPRARILTIERRYVPRCSHLTAASLPMANAFAESHGTRVPTVVHNCHPFSARNGIDQRRVDRTDGSLSLFWFSQTVGLDRGLQDAIRAAGLVDAPLQLHVRGSVGDDVRRTLEQLADASGLRGRLHLHPACAPDELLARAAEHDVGLALETEASLNRQLTVTNKLFLYLTAGLAVAATDLPGQRGIAGTASDAIALYRAGDVEALRRVLAVWANRPEALAAAKQAALEAARTRWNAETEGRHLVTSVAACVPNAAFSMPVLV